MRSVFHFIGRALLFAILGVLTGVPGELNYSYLLRHDFPNFLHACAFNFFYLLIAFVLCTLIERLIPSRRIAFIIMYFIAGTVGLMIEWFMIGNSPRGNPAAMQSAMFSYWGALVIVPYILLGPEMQPPLLRRNMLVFWMLWSIASLGLTYWSLGIDPQLGFAVGVWSVIAEYIGFNYFFYLYARYALAKDDDANG